MKIELKNLEIKIPKVFTVKLKNLEIKIPISDILKSIFLV